MNNSLEEIKKLALQSGKNFVYNTEEDIDEEKQVAYIYFVGKNKGKEVVHDVFMCTLSFDYKMAVWDEAEEKMIAIHPALEGKDYLEYTEKQQDQYDEILDEIYEKNLVRVQETLELYEHESENMVGVEITLNVPELTDEIISKFVKDYNADTLMLDDELHTFSWDEDDDEE